MDRKPIRAGAAECFRRHLGLALDPYLLSLAVAFILLGFSVACAIVLITWPSPAHAQTTPRPKPPCYAAPLGAGTLATEHKHADGIGRYYWCPVGDDWVTVVTAQANGYRLVIPTDVPASAPMQDLLDAAWRANVTRDCGPASTDTRIGAICRATWAAAKADPNRPKAFSWRVAPNPSSTSTPPTRPMWDPAGAKQVDERAPVGALCDCSKRLAKGTQTLCPLSPFTDPPATGNLTACTRTQD